jgi:hypothetical protein
VELQYLQGLFSHALQAAAAASRLAATSDTAAGSVAAAAMRLMSSILGWEFKGAQCSALSSSSAALAAAAAEVRGLEIHSAEYLPCCALASGEITGPLCCTEAAMHPLCGSSAPQHPRELEDAFPFRLTCVVVGCLLHPMHGI